MAFHGDFYEPTKAGRMFWMVSAATGVVIPIYTTTAPTFGILNPVGSVVDVVLHELLVGLYDTTGAATNLWASFQNSATGPATGSKVTALTVAARGTEYENCKIFDGPPTAVQPFPLTATLTAASEMHMPLGLSQLVTTFADATVTPFELRHDFKSLIVPPGTFFQIVGAKAPLTKYNFKLLWEEVAA